MPDGSFRTLVAGTVSAPLVRLAAPLSLWGGFDLETGLVCDVSHPDLGVLLTGKIIAMPGARGSSSSSSALVEAVRKGIGPAAIILSRTDPILVIGGLVARDLYGTQMPILLADAAAWDALPANGMLAIDAPENSLARVSRA